MELRFDEVVKHLGAKGIPAYVEQTGGGTATIYAGELRKVEREAVAWYPASGAEGPEAVVVDGKVRVDHGTVTEERWQACAGPGWFAGPGWSDGRGDTSDFVVGKDDDGEGEYVAAEDDWDEARVADEIAKVVLAP